MFSQLEFRYAVHQITDMPPDVGAEVAFAGRSNAGKSTAINALANRRKLAFVSKTPGRTQAINFFDMGNHCSLVDLPGYGYAKVPKPEQERWDALISTYITNRNSLILLVIVVDARHGLKPLDWQMLDWLAPTGKAVHILLTKSDKLTRQESTVVLQRTEEELKQYPGEATAQIFSGANKTGVKQAQAVVARWLKK
ncbi:MAG: ribosome biogenesis GTP-binding protein YihA/YsxC [Burkholderiales bacterium]